MQYCESKKVKVLVVQLCPTLCDPMASLSVKFSRQEEWSRSPVPSPGYLPNLGIEPRSPALQVNSLPSEPLGKSLAILSSIVILKKPLVKDFITSLSNPLQNFRNLMKDSFFFFNLSLLIYYLTLIYFSISHRNTQEHFFPLSNPR